MCPRSLSWLCLWFPSDALRRHDHAGNRPGVGGAVVIQNAVGQFGCEKSIGLLRHRPYFCTCVGRSGRQWP